MLNETHKIISLFNVRIEFLSPAECFVEEEGFAVLGRRGFRWE